MNCAQLSRRANELKKQLSEGQGDTRVIRYNLQNVYRELLLTDLEYALDKKLEQELWNNIFKNHVSSLQAKVRDKMNPKRSELQSMLTLTLDSATGFFLQLLHELCSAFDLELPFCVKATRFGVTKKLRQRFQKVVIPQISSCLYICQYCLVHLGDLARYRNDTDQAHMYYNHAVTLIPTNGQPYNQLAIVSASKSDQLSMAFYYIRSIAVKHPFPAALTNLQSTFSKLVDRDEMKIFKMRDVELIHYFIKFHAVIYMAGGEADLQIASTIKTKLEENFRDHLSQESLTARQLVQIMAINIFALCSIKQLDENGALPNKKNEDGPSDHDHLTDTADEEQCWKLTLDLTLTLSQLLLYHTPISPKEGLAWHGLAAIRVLLEWLQHHPKVLTDETVSGKYLFWNRLGKLLSMLSQLPETNRPNQSTLWEDLLLNGFRPLQEAHSELDFSSSKAKHLTKEESNSARVMRIVKSGAKLASLQPSLLLMKKGEPISFSSPQHDAQAELDKTLHPRSSKAAALALRRKVQQIRVHRNSLGYDTVPTNHDGEDADDDEDDDEDDDDDDDGDDEFEEMEKMTVGTQVIEPKPSSKTNSQDAPKERNRVSFKLEKNMVIPPPTVSQQPHQPSPPNHPSQQNRPHFPPHMPRGYPVHYPRQGPPQQMAPHQGTYPPPSGWNPPAMPPRPQFQNFRNPRPPQQALGPQGPSHGPHMTHGPPMHHGPQQHHGPQPPHGPSVSHGPQAPHGGQHMPPQMWQQQQQPPPQPRHMPPFMGNQAGTRYTGPLPAQNRQTMSPQNYTNPQQQISRESPVEGEQSHESYPSQPWNTQMMPPSRGFVRNGPMRIPQEEGRMLDPSEREPSRQYDKRSRGMAQFRAQPQEFNPSSYPDVPPRSPFGPDNGPTKSHFGHLERNGLIGKQGVDVFYDQRGQGTKEDDQVGFMNFLNNMPQGEMDGSQHQRGTNFRQSSAMEPPNYQKAFFNNDYQRKSSGDDFGTFSPHQLPSPNARSPSQGFFDDSSFNTRQPNGELSRQRKNGSPWNDPQVSSSFMQPQQQQQQQPGRLSPVMGKQDEPLALLQQLMTPPTSEPTAVSRSSWSLGTDDRMTQNNESTGFAGGGRTNRTPPFGPSWPPDSPGSWAGGQELQFGDPFPSSPQELLNQDGSGSRVIGTRRQSGSLTADSDSTNFFSGSDSSYSLFSSPSPWSDKSKRDSLGGTSPFSSLHPREDDKQGTSSNLFGGLGWSIPPSDQISGSPTSTLLPERIQSIWSSPASSGGVEPPNMDKLLRDKPET